MKAVCCICFNLLDDLHIAACPCGHTFHEECLMRWIDTSSTCPSCRTDINKDQIIKRLFFDIDENSHKDVDVDMLLNQINNLKVQLGEKEKQRQEITESRDRLSTLFADSEAAREILLTKLNEEKNIKDVMQRDLTVILKENTAFIKEMNEFRNQSKLQELQNNETLLKECKSDAQEVVGQYSGDDEPSLKHIASLLTVFKRDYQKVLLEKTILQEQMSELKHSHSEAEKYKVEVKNLRNFLQWAHSPVIKIMKGVAEVGATMLKLNKCVRRCATVTRSIFQEMRDHSNNYIVKYNNLRKVLSKRTLLQRNVSKPNLSYQSKTLKLKMNYLGTDFALIRNKLDEMQVERNKIFIQTVNFNEELLKESYPFSNYICPNIYGCMEDMVNTDTCTSATVSHVSRENLKRKFVSEIDGPKLKSANLSPASVHLEVHKVKHRCR